VTVTDDPTTTLRDVVAGHAELDPDRIAVIAVTDDCTRSYSELVARADSLGAGLRARGVAPGDVVVIWMENSASWIEALLACTSIGVIAVPVNPEWRDAEAGYVFRHATPRAIVCDAGLAGRAAALAPGAILVADRVAGAEAPAAGLAYEELAAAGTAAVRHPTAPTDPCLIIYTSGTTSGQPKGVIWTHETVVDKCAREYARIMDVHPRDRSLFISPLFHANALAGCLSALIAGASVVFPRRFSRSGFWPIVDRYRPTYLFTLLPLLNIVLSGSPGPIVSENSLRSAFVLGSSKIRTDLSERLGGIDMLDAYGLSECPVGSFVYAGDDTPPGSAGRPSPRVQMRVVDEDGRDCKPEQVGEVVFADDGIFGGYFRPTATQIAAVVDGWFHTGDLGYFDESGYFYFVDRVKDIVRRAGENISSLEVEAVLRGAPGVREIAIVARPDETIGERVTAFVIPDETGSLNLDGLRAHGAATLAAYKLPDALIEVEEFPRTASGKIQKFQLRQNHYA
jgi:acyl-CoA synthetase (AMP-forming)/AMP-acid ligase II